MSVTIDRSRCIAYGACWEICPEVFEENPDDGLIQIVAQYRLDGNPEVGEIPDKLEDCVREAAADCPVDVIYVE